MSKEGIPSRSSKEGKPDLTRRQFIAAEAALGASGLIATAAVGKVAIEKSRGAEKQPIPREWWKSVVYTVPADLVGKSISPLELAYIKPAQAEYESEHGEPEPPTWPLPAKDLDHPDIPAFPLVYPPIDFATNLDHIMALKKHTAEDADVPDAGVQMTTFDARAKEYRAKWELNEVRRMNLNEFKKLLELESTRMRVLLEKNMPAIVDSYLRPLIEKDETLTRDDKEKLILQLHPYLSYLAEHISPEVLLSYIATEIMPTPERSIPLLEFIMKNAGLEYLERIPALGDSELSYGPFQLTRHVVGESDEETGRETGSVTKLLSVAGADNVLPASLADFTTMEQHLQAGYLVAFQNVLMAAHDMVRDGSYNQLKMISQSVSPEAKKANSTVFVEYVSAAHHRPSDARAALEHSMDDNKNMPTHLRNSSLEGYFPNSPGGREVEQYALKTRENYLKLSERLG